MGSVLHNSQILSIAISLRSWTGAAAVAAARAAASGEVMAESKWPSDDGAVTHDDPNYFMKQPWTQVGFWAEDEQEEAIVGMVQFPQDCNRGKGQSKMSVVPFRQIPANETTAGKTIALQ